MFDEIYFCGDKAKASSFVDTHKMPFELPHIYIFDKNQKFEGYIFDFQKPEKELSGLIEKYMDENLPATFVSEEARPKSRVKWVNAENFE